MKNKVFNPNYIKLLKRLWGHLPSRRRKQLFVLTLLMIFCAFIEVLSLGALLPFIGILTAPDRIFKYEIVVKFAHFFNYTNSSELVLPLTIGFITAAIGSGVARLFLLRISTKLAFACGADLSAEVYRRTLYQSYSVHMSRNSSSIISGITLKVTLAVNVLYQILTLISSLILLTAIGMTLLVINPLIAISCSVGFGFCYVLISFFSRNKLSVHSKLIATNQTQAIKALQEGLGGIRDVLLDSTQPIFCEIYKKADRPMRDAKGDIIYLSGKPRFIMEAVGMVLIAAIAFYFNQSPEGVAGALPALAALALGAQRMLPAFQQAYASYTTILGDQASLSDTIDLLDQPIDESLLIPPPQSLEFKKEIRFKDVTFKYSSDGPAILKELSFVIPKGKRVGFVGTTGSGKSTTLDLLMGLLNPTDGEILIDDVSIKGTTARAWQQTIAHVPQTIFLADASIAENIAFGVPKHLIDLERVQKAAKQAHISEFVEKSPEGYNTFVGERGVRLSGGQRQRIGIARALYKQASVLIFDEATSALDNATEKSVMEAIDGLDRDLTILIIAHRLETVRRCDFILEIDQGRVLAEGPFDRLMEISPSFKKMNMGH